MFPLGWKDRDFVRRGNLMAARVAILCLMVAFAQCTFVVEQPVALLRSRIVLFSFACCVVNVEILLTWQVSSLFWRCDRWLWMIKLLRRLSVTVWGQHIKLGAFGAPSQKPLTLKSNNRQLLEE